MKGAELDISLNIVQSSTTPSLTLSSVLEHIIIYNIITPLCQQKLNIISFIKVDYMAEQLH